MEQLETPMATLTIRNVDAAVKERLRLRAARHGMDVSRRDREFDVSALQGRLSTSSQSQCSTAPGLIAGTWHRPLFLTRDRWFESGSLHRRVRQQTGAGNDR